MCNTLLSSNAYQLLGIAEPPEVEHIDRHWELNAQRARARARITFGVAEVGEHRVIQRQHSPIVTLIHVTVTRNSYWISVSN